MPIFDQFLTRRRRMPHFSALARHVRRRLAPVCQELSLAEEELAARLGLPEPPRLLLVDEETAVVITPGERPGTY